MLILLMLLKDLCFSIILTLHETFVPETVRLTQMRSKHHHFIFKQYIQLFTLEYRRLVTDGWWLRLESVYLAAAEMGCVMCEV